jgi:hypothetical protein
MRSVYFNGQLFRIPGRHDHARLTWQLAATSFLILENHQPPISRIANRKRRADNDALIHGPEIVVVMGYGQHRRGVADRASMKPSGPHEVRNPPD